MKYKIVIQGIHPREKRIHEGINLSSSLQKSLIILQKGESRYCAININQIISLQIIKQ